MKRVMPPNNRYGVVINRVMERVQPWVSCPPAPSLEAMASLHVGQAAAGRANRSKRSRLKISRRFITRAFCTTSNRLPRRLWRHTSRWEKSSGPAACELRFYLEGLRARFEWPKEQSRWHKGCERSRWRDKPSEWVRFRGTGWFHEWHDKSGKRSGKGSKPKKPIP